MDVSRLESALIVDVAELSGEVRERIATARNIGQPVFFIRQGHFVGLLRPISEEQSTEMTHAALSEMARKLATGNDK